MAAAAVAEMAVPPPPPPAAVALLVSRPPTAVTPPIVPPSSMTMMMQQHQGPANNKLDVLACPATTKNREKMVTFEDESPDCGLVGSTPTRIKNNSRDGNNIFM